MQVLCLGFFFSNDIDSIEFAKLWDVIQNLAAIVLFVLNRVEAEVKLCQQAQSLNILQLQHLHDVVKRQVQETERVDVLQTSKEADVVFREVEVFE